MDAKCNGFTLNRSMCSIVIIQWRTGVLLLFVDYMRDEHMYDGISNKNTCEMAVCVKSMGKIKKINYMIVNYLCTVVTAFHQL